MRPVLEHLGAITFGSLSLGKAEERKGIALLNVDNFKCFALSFQSTYYG